MLIIHGKGQHSSGGEAVLKPLVLRYLNGHPAIRATGQAKLEDGGSGATWAIFKV